MKKIIMLCVIAACAGKAKAQQTLKFVYDNVKISQNIGKFKFNSLRVGVPAVKLQELMAYNKQPDYAVNNGIYKASPDNMPVVKLHGNSKMPVAKLNGNDNMPIVKTGLNNEELFKLLKQTPGTKAPAAPFQVPQK